MNNLYDDYKEEKKEQILYDTDNICNKNNRKHNFKKMNENKKNLILTIIMILVLIGIISGFIFYTKSNKENNNYSPKPSVTNPEKEENKEEEKKKVTIIDTDSNTRPYAVMINCHNGALPQAGLNNAYIVYELMVEGGITRMMALFKDKEVNKIGSIRSARNQYLDYVLENDAIYMHILVGALMLKATYHPLE